jgi:hypothetical protein
MGKRLVKLPSFAGVATGQTAILDVPKLGVYDKISLYYTESGSAVNQATMETAITECRIKINGKTQRIFSAQQLFDLNAFHGISVTDGWLHIYFAEPWLRTTAGEDAMGWGTSGLSSFQIEVDIASGRTSPALIAYALKSPVKREIGAIKKWKRHTFPVSATGAHQVTSLPKIDAYSAVHFQTANISDIEVKVGTIPEFEDITRAMIHEHLLQEGYTPQSDWTHLDIQALTSRLSDKWPMRNSAGETLSEFRIDVNFTGTGNFTILSETLGAPD